MLAKIIVSMCTEVAPGTTLKDGAELVRTRVLASTMLSAVAVREMADPAKISVSAVTVTPPIGTEAVIAGLRLGFLSIDDIG